MMAMEKYLSTSSLEPALTEMIRLRASQINGCAYCIDMHSKAAIKHSEPANKLFTENEIAQMIVLIGLINTWNRMAISTHMFHEK